MDGTLIDSKLDIANSVNAALKYFDLKPIKNEKIYEFVGTGVRQLLVDCLRLQGKMDVFDDFFEYFLNYYYQHLLDNTVLYDGVLEMLQYVRKKYELFVVTNKSEIFAYKVVEGLGIDGYFKDVVGGDTFNNKKPHPEPIEKLSKKHKLSIKNSFIVGDSESDIELAKSVGFGIIWASYGFRDVSILDRYSVDFVVNSPKELISIL